MSNFYKQGKWLQQISPKLLKAKERHRLSRDISYPESFEEPEEWYRNTLIDRHGKEHTMRLLNRPGERNDSYFIEYNGSRVYYNRSGNLVLNATRWPLILGLSDAMRFMAKQFPRIGAIK